jgi:hypothetical protein
MLVCILLTIYPLLGYLKIVFHSRLPYVMVFRYFYRNYLNVLPKVNESYWLLKIYQYSHYPSATIALDSSC